MTITLALLAALPAIALPPSIQDSPPESFEEFVGQLSFRTGAVTIAGNSVSMDLPEGWALLEGRDARRVVEDFWGNPADPTTLAFLDPPSADGRLAASYGIIVTMDDSGYVSDEDALEIDYASLLSDIQADARSANEVRAEAGYESIEILGWAEPPHYDSAEKKLYWAKELSFGGSPSSTLNYDVRILSRRGYLQLQAVAPMTALGDVDAGMKSLLPITHFTDGNRYSDFDSSTDNIAAYGIGAMIGGKVAAKVGLFAVIAKFGKLIAVGVIGIFVGAKKFLFGRRENEYAYEEEEAEGEDAERG